MVASRDKLRMVEVAAMRDVALAALQNPIVTLVGGVILVSAAEKAKIVDRDWATVLKGGIVGVATMQALAPIVKEGGLTGALMALVAGAGTGGLTGAMVGGSLKKLPILALDPTTNQGIWDRVKQFFLGFFG
jgi:hypothetical protein